MMEMIFYVHVTNEGMYEVQNMVMGMEGQFHVHTKEGFEKWREDINEKCIVFLEK